MTAVATDTTMTPGSVEVSRVPEQIARAHLLAARATDLDAGPPAA